MEQSKALFFSFNLPTEQFQQYLPASQEFKQDARTLLTRNADFKNDFAQDLEKGTLLRIANGSPVSNYVTVRSVDFILAAADGLDQSIRRHLRVKNLNSTHTSSRTTKFFLFGLLRSAY